MFCSKCGKTIHPMDEQCPHCHAAIGENRFGGTPYTSAQFIIEPGQTTFGPVNNYTRTTYTSKGEEAEENSEVDSRTTYRPVYEAEKVPKELKIELKNGPKIGDVVEDDDSVANFIPGVPLSKAAQETLSELDEELKPDEQIDRSQFMSRPIQSTGRAGISRDVSEYIRHLEDSQSRKGGSRRGRHASGEVYDDYADDPNQEYAPQADGYEDDGYYDEDGEGEYIDDRRGFGLSQIIKIVVALIVVAALAFGVITWIRYVRGNQSSAPIEGVSESLYNEGIALVQSHTDQSYVDGLVSTYASDGLISTTAKIQEGKDAVNALLPAEPATNDQTFIDALQAIEDNIGNAVIMDGLAASGENANEEAGASEARWQIVNNSIAQLQAATSAAELTAIINGETITVQSNTPEPTQVPQTYNTLSRGDENNEVMQLQVRLYNLGYLQGDRDGVFGSKTATAVSLFQQTVGLEVTGRADNETQVRLFADDAPYAPGATTPTPAVTSQPTPEPEDESAEDSAEEPLIEPAEAEGASESEPEGTPI